MDRNHQIHSQSMARLGGRIRRQSILLRHKRAVAVELVLDNRPQERHSHYQSNQKGFHKRHLNNHQHSALLAERTHRLNNRRRHKRSAARVAVRAVDNHHHRRNYCQCTRRLNRLATSILHQNIR